MRWLKREICKAGLTVAGMLLLLVLMVWIPASAAGTYERASGLATPVTGTVQATPTEDTTVTELNKEKLKGEVAQQQHTWENWLWSSNAATTLSTLALIIGALFGLWRWRRDRQDAQNKELADRKNEREKRAEERFEKIVEGLGSDREEVKVGAAIMLRTFLGPDYQQFYKQAFDLAVVHLRLPETTHSPENPDASLPLTTLSQALIIVFKEAFPLARDELKKQKEKPFNPQSLDAAGIQLDNAYIREADLERVWMPVASLQKADLSGVLLSEANLSEANLGEATLPYAMLKRARLREATLSGADLSGAKLNGAKLNGAKLNGANFSETAFRRTTIRLSGTRFSMRLTDPIDPPYAADLSEADLTGADLSGANLSKASLGGADLTGADLSGANLSKASLRGANLTGTGLSKADLSEADLFGATLSNANLEDTLSLKDTILRKVTGLTKEQLEACKAKGAFIDEDSIIPVKCLNFALVIDHSGSMRGEKLKNVKDAVKMVIERLEPTDYISVVIFDDTCRVIIPSMPARDPIGMKHAIDRIQNAGGKTMSLGMIQGLNELRRWNIPDAICRMILLTDGVTYGDADRCRQLARDAAASSISIYPLGIGSDWDESLLNEIGQLSCGMPAKFIRTPVDAMSIFE